MPTGEEESPGESPRYEWRSWPADGESCYRRKNGKYTGGVISGLRPMPAASKADVSCVSVSSLSVSTTVYSREYPMAAGRRAVNASARRLKMGSSVLLPTLGVPS